MALFSISSRSYSSSPSLIFALLFKKDPKLIHSEVNITMCTIPPKRICILVVLKILKDLQSWTSSRHLCVCTHVTTLLGRLGQKGLLFVSSWIRFYGLLYLGAWWLESEAAPMQRMEDWPIRTSTLDSQGTTYHVFYMNGTHNTIWMVPPGGLQCSNPTFYKNVLRSGASE